MLTIISSIFIPSAFTQEKPLIHSILTNAPPNIDGVFSTGEWDNLVILFKAPEYPSNYVLPTYAYMLHDNAKLYVMVDAVGDVTDDAGDECLLIFDFNSDPTDGYIIIRIRGTSIAFTKSSNDFDASVGFGASPNSGITHKIYEFAIPLSYINTRPNQIVDFCSPHYKTAISMPYDSSNGNDNIYPIGLGTGDEWQESANGWGLLFLSNPVGGYLAPMNGLAILAPYLVLVGLIVVSSAMAMRIWRKP